MKGLCRTALAIVVIAACGRDGAITEPTAPNAPALPPGVLALGVDSTTGASIETNKDDYSPGEVVHLVGRGWAPGETVNLHMVEDPNTHADVDTNVVADASGGFSIHFYDVQTHDLGVTFTLTAMGSRSHSVAIAVFTDNVPIEVFTLNGVAAVTVAPGASVNAVVSGNVNGGSGGTTLGSISVRSYLDGFSAATSVQLACFDVSPDVVHSSGGAIPYTTAFTFSAPAGTATYDVFAASYGNNTCSGTPIQTKTLDNGIIIQNTNTVPSVDAGADATINEGSTFSQNGSFTDPDANSWTATVDYGDGSGTQALSLSGKTFSLSHVYTDNGTYNVTVTVNDGTASGSDVVVVTVNNVAPTATFNAPSPVNEGSNISLSLTSPVDPSSDDIAAGFTYEFDCGLGAGYESSSTNTRSCPTTDNGSRTVKGKILDKDGGFTAYSATVTIDNVAPTLTSVTGPAAPVAVNTSASITLNFTDPAGSYDTYTAAVNWDDGQGYVSAGGVTSGGSVSKTFTSAGIYTVCAKVSDDDGGTSNEVCFAYIVVYDPSAGFVTGGGWINSPAGAYVADASLAGKANFGFVSKYKRGATIPEGNTEFQFHAGGLNFHSSTYQWLVVNQAGTNAQFKGTGTINGAGSYTFMLWATDAGNTGDKFRIQITDNNNADAVVYDNGAEQVISSGSIVIHTGGKK